MRHLVILRLKTVLSFICLACAVWLLAWHFLSLAILDAEVVSLPEQINPRVVVGISMFGTVRPADLPDGADTAQHLEPVSSP